MGHLVFKPPLEQREKTTGDKGRQDRLRDLKAFLALLQSLFDALAEGFFAGA